MQRAAGFAAVAVAALAAAVIFDLTWGPHARLKAGDRMPDFVLSAPGGGVYRSSNHSGKVILVNFFASW